MEDEALASAFPGRVMSMVRAMALSVSCLVAGCTSEGGPGNCGYAVAITSASCTFYDHPDVFEADSWFINTAGTAAGPESTQLSINDLEDESIQISTTCDNWPNFAAHTCVAAEGDPASSNWTSEIEILTNGSPLTATVVAKVTQVLTNTCQGEESDSLVVSCP